MLSGIMAADMESQKVKVTKVFLSILLLNSLAYGLDISDDTALAELKSKLEKQPEGIKSELLRKGNQTIEIKNYVAIDGSLSSAKSILKNFGQYSNWALEGINQSPRGGNYFMRLLDVVWKKTEPEIVGIQFLFNFPLLKHTGIRKFKVTHREDQSTFEIKANNVEQADPFVKSCEGIVKIFPTPQKKDKLWVYIHGKAVLQWALYEVLPERVVTKEIGERVHTVLLNYQKKEEALPVNPSPPPQKPSKS